MTFHLTFSVHIHTYEYHEFQLTDHTAYWLHTQKGVGTDFFAFDASLIVYTVSCPGFTSESF